MLISRGLSAYKLLNTAKKFKNARNMSAHAYYYRVSSAPPSRANVILADLLGGLMWWWILWHLWHEHEHITGEFPYPDPSKWTDEELGVE